jgi:hypothetical protein
MYEDIVMPLQSAARVTAEEGEQLTRWKYMHLFEGGRRLLTKMKNTLKNNCAFSSAVVKFCKVFTCLVNSMK